MGTTGRQTLTLVLAVSGLAHAGVLALLALKHPRLRAPTAPPVFEVEMVPMFAPRHRPPTARSVSHARGRADHERPAPGSGAPAPEALGVPPPLPSPGLDEGVRRVLRRGLSGCANLETTRLDAAERDACLERLGDGAAAAPFIAPPIGSAKRAAFDDKSAARERMRIYRQGGVPPGGEAHVHPQLGYVPSITTDILKAAR